MIFSKHGLPAVIICLLLIAGGAYWFVFYGPRAEAVPDAAPDEQTSYAFEEELDAVSEADGSAVESALIGLFDEGRLIEVSRYDIPESDGAALVLASPSKSGKDENVNCDIRGHRYCGLYRVSPEGSRLLMWGARLAGFAGVERFPDADHVIMATAWNMLGFTSIERHQLDLRTGECVPKLLIELDIGRDFAEMRVSGHGDDASLYIHGAYDRGRVIPERIYVKDGGSGGRIRFELDEQTVLGFASSASSSGDILQPIFIYPSDSDVDTLVIRIDLYGEPFEWDLKTNEIVRSS
jgi:hypothetical protein